MEMVPRAAWRPDIVIWHAMGIALMIGFLSKQLTMRKQEPDETIQLLVTDLFWTLLVLGLGFILNCLAF